MKASRRTSKGLARENDGSSFQALAEAPKWEGCGVSQKSRGDKQKGRVAPVRWVG